MQNEMCKNKMHKISSQSKKHFSFARGEYNIMTLLNFD